eukprot:CAMPEP_0179478650 /NCGR_PEP_ID=MMETSP0799-20121207/57078_1 /TAXON_ID=46947 /ORGANISM="Geminigera cryophila, Strain CCMP2564" /LENGTH=98 /DNA_ID=CAMNT_0021289869 /DNA_START=23 /DNA_END=321 /DNA_ORIENTATION=-
MTLARDESRNALGVSGHTCRGVSAVRPGCGGEETYKYGGEESRGHPPGSASASASESSAPQRDAPTSPSSEPAALLPNPALAALELMMNGSSADGREP